MATVKDILGSDSLKFENEFKAQGLSGDKLESAMVKLARDTRTQRETQTKQAQEQKTQEQNDRVKNSYGDDSLLHGIGRGAAEANSRLIAFGNYVGIVPDDIAKKNAQILDDLEKRRELDSNKNMDEAIKFDLDKVKKDIDNYTSKPIHTQMEEQQYKFDLERLSKLEQRPSEKEALKQESAKATGFIDNAKAGIETLVDTAMHPKEWTTQGVVAGVLPTDPANALSLITGGIGGRILTKVGGSVLTKTSFGAADGVLTNAGVEYGVAKGTFKSDEEAKRAAIQGGIAGGVLPATFGAIGANTDMKLPNITDNKSQVIDSKPQISEIQKQKAYDDVLSNQFLKDEQTQAPFSDEQTSQKLEDGLRGEQLDDARKETLIKSELDRESINTIKTIAQAEQDSSTIHEDVKIKLQEAMNNGASIDEMISIRNGAEITQSELFITKILNNNEPTTNRLAGFRIVSVIEDTIKNARLTPDEVKQKLIDENVSPELATVASKSYMLKKTDMLIDFIQNKVNEHLDTNHANLRKEIDSKVDFYNKQKIADEELWTNSLTKKSLDDYISKEIGDDNITPNQRDLIQELNKIGLVEDVVSAKLKSNINGQYDMNNNNITLNSSIPNIQKAQVLTHEYVHSALGRLVENKKFNDELTFLMGDAQKQFKANKKDIKQYGFTNVQDFAAEAFSNPYFARDLNDVKLSADAKVKLGVKDYINTLWEAIVTKFNDVIFESTGKRIKLDPDSYYGALSSMIHKELNDVNTIKEQRLDSGDALSVELKQPIEQKTTPFDNLKLHPRYDELLKMREDVKASDIKYDKKVLNKGTVIHDENKFGGNNKTQVVPSSYERNYNADFKLTKKDIENIRAGKIDENITQKLKDDLSTLDNHPDWKKYSDDINIKDSKDILGEDFSDSYYINKDGKLVDNGKVLFSKDSDLGSDYVEFKSKPDEAIDYLLEVQNGQVNGAIYKEGIGNIDFVWGESRIQAGKVKGYGLAKIKDKHGIDAVRNIPNVIKNGEITKRSDKHIEISDGKYNAIVYLDWFDGVKNWLMTSYEKKPNSQTFTDVNSKVEKSDNLISKVSSDKIVSNKNNKNKKRDENFPRENKVYHTSGIEIEKLDSNKILWTSSDMNYTRKYGKKNSRITYEIDTKDLKILDGYSKEGFELLKEANKKAKNPMENILNPDKGVSSFVIQDKNVIKFIKDKGFDGVKTSDSYSTKNEAIGIINPEKVKLNKIDSSSSNILYSKNFPEEKKSIFEKYDALSDSAIDKLDNFFKGVTEDGKINPETTNIGNMLRKGFVPNSLKAKDFVQLLHDSNAERQRMMITAKSLQEKLSKIPKAQNELLVMALDGDIPKENIKTTLDAQTYELYTKMRSKVDTNANELVKLGMLDESAKVEDYIKRFYKEHLESKSVIRGLFKSGHKLDKNFKRKDLTKEQRDKLNQVRDAGYVVARTLLEQNNQIRKAKFLDTLANEYAVSEPKDGFEQVPTKKDGSINVFGNLAGKYVPKHIMDELNGLYDFGKAADNVVQKNVKNFSRWLKGTWTAGNPSTHLYNVGSNMINLYLNGMIFTTKNGRLGGGKKGIEGLKKFFDKDTRESYKEELTAAGLYDDSFFSTLESVVDDLDKTTKDNFSFKDLLNGVLFRKDSKITKAVENVYDLEDKIFRVFVYEEQKWDLKVEKYKKEFGKIESWSEARSKIEAIELTNEENIKAMNEAKDMFVDYSKPVPTWLSSLDNYMIAPFARYTYLATIRQSKVAIKHPFRALAYSFGFGEALKAVFGEGEDLDDNDPLKPDYMKTSITNFNMYGIQNFTKLKDTKDEATYFNEGRLTPGFKMFQATLGFYHDLYKIVFEAEGKYGQKLFNKEEPTSIQFAKGISALSESTLPPLFPIGITIYEGPRLTEAGNLKKDKNDNPMDESAIFGGRYMQKAIRAKNGILLDRYGKPVPVEDVVKQLLGVKLERIDKKEEAVKQAKTITDTLNYNTNRSDAFKNPTIKEDAKKEYTKKMDEIKKAAPGFNLGSSKKDDFSFNDKSIKFDF